MLRLALAPPLMPSPSAPQPGRSSPGATDSGAAAPTAIVVVERVRAALGPFVLTGTLTAPAAAWYDATVFTLPRLTQALGATDAQTLVGFWTRFKILVTAVRPETPLAPDDVQAYERVTGHVLTAQARGGRGPKANDPGMVLRRLERVIDPRLFHGTSEAPSLEQFEATLFKRHGLEPALGVAHARVVLHLWRRFVRAVRAIRASAAEV